MNKILISSTKPDNLDKKTFFIEFSQANDILAILRNDHFLHCQIQLPQQINNSQLRFSMHLKRLLNQQGQVVLNGSAEVINKAKTIFKTLGLFIKVESQRDICFVKKEKKVEVVEKKQQKLAIGFKGIVDEQIDEDDLLKNQNIDLSKNTKVNCQQKVRACANCNCGRKELEALPSKQELIKSVNQGKPVSGCGKCYLGDSFRCATCPYQGLPAFKPGDKLKLVDESKVIVETGTTSVSNGKVKIQL